MDEDYRDFVTVLVHLALAASRQDPEIRKLGGVALLHFAGQVMRNFPESSLAAFQLAHEFNPCLDEQIVHTMQSGKEDVSPLFQQEFQSLVGEISAGLTISRAVGPALTAVAAVARNP